MADVAGGSALPPLRLRAVFDPVPTSAWESVVRQDLKGQDYETRLIWRTDEGLAIKPFYRSEDLTSSSEGSAAEAVLAPIRTSGSWRIAESQSWPADAIRADRLHDAGANAVQELGWAMAEACERLATALDSGHTLLAAAKATSFVLAVGSTYFVEIAKLRAARVLWAQVLDAFASSVGEASPDADALQLHVRTARRNKSAYEPYTNLLRATTEAMSAVIGGADALVVEAHGFDAHLAVNAQHILAHEAHLAVVADPAAGSYFVETLTDSLAREAWSLLQAVEAAGGYTAAVRSGLRDEQVRAARLAREQAVATRRRVLVGVNDYPDPEAPPASGPFPAHDADPALPSMRLAAAFEGLRARTARHAAATGRTPFVHLLTRGDVAMRNARANFCLNLFGCAGFTITQGSDLSPDADLLVLCSADDAYAELASAIVPVATAPVIVAGHPKGLTATLSPLGVQGFVHAGMDVLQTLTHWQDRLGMVS